MDLSVVVPLFNERESLPVLVDRLHNVIGAEGLTYEIMLVDDGSTDGSWEEIKRLSEKDDRVKGIRFGRNYGKSPALNEGFRAAQGRVVITMDADLQDDISVVPEMLDLYARGCDIVYGVRNDRRTDTAFKRRTAAMFYGMMRWLKVPLVPHHADYRLVARAVLDVLPGIKEQKLFLRGLFPSMGFRSGSVYYARLSRRAGETKYPFWKMLSFAWQGITSCSAAPLRLAGIMSFLCMLAAVGYSLVSLYKYMAGETIQGWTSMIIVVLMLGSVQLFCLAVMGEYLAKIFTEVRRKPRYIVEKVL